MEGKFMGLIIGAVVSIMLVGSLLMPIINDASTKEAEEVAEGAYSFMSYQPEPEPMSTYPYRYIHAVNVDGVYTISHGPANAMEQIETISSDDLLGTDQIIYADSNVILYVSNGVLSAKYNGQVTTTDSPQYGFWVQNGGTSSKCSIGTTTVYSGAPVPTYYYVTNPDGDYANFTGDNPPSMDTPLVAVAGMYIGERYTTVTTNTPGSAIYMAMPLILLSALLIAVASIVVKSRY